MKIFIEGNSQTLIHILCKRSQCAWNVATIIEDIQLIAEDLEEIFFRHVFRSKIEDDCLTNTIDVTK